MIYNWEHNQVLSLTNLPFTHDIDQADILITWNDIYPVERSLIDFARKRGKKTYVMQHGRRGSSQYYPPFSKQIYADKMLVWGEGDKKALVEAGHPSDKIEVVGCPLLTKLKPKVPHKGINIVFSPEHWDRPLEENLKVRDELRKLKGVKITTKLINSPSHQDKYDRIIRTTVGQKDHIEKCIDVLKWADLVVGISESTFELLAQAMDIPVVIMEEWEPKAFGGDTRYVNYRRVISRASKRANMSNLLKVIKDQLKNPDELKREREEVVMEEGGKWDESHRLFKR